MNRTNLIVATAAVLLVSAFSFAAGVLEAPRPAATQDGISVYFSPKGGCEEAVVAQIAGAKTSVDVQAYSFTNADIAKALVDAKKRGVRVRVVLDKSNQKDKYTAATFLMNNGITPLIDSKHAIAHNKIMIIDGSTVITGSMNFSRAGDESNAENLVIITGKATIAEAYAKNFTLHHEHSEAYAGAAR